MRDKIVEAVARAIEKSIFDGFEIGDVLIEAGDGKHRVDGVIGLADIARAAIEAYEAEKRGAAEPYVVRVENGVTYWSNGLCSQSVPGLKEFAEAQMMEYRAYLRRGIP